MPATSGLFTDVTANSVAELVPALEAANSADRRVWYRGHGNVTWKLLPTLARRSGGREAEAALIKRFRQNAAVASSARPTDAWGWLFLMQHHGAPTRLLDWSENPLVAAYFATSDPSALDKDGCIWCLDPEGLNEHATIQSTVKGDLPFFGLDKELEAYSTDSVSGSAHARKPPVAALAARQFPRVIAQAGVFTITHYNQMAVEEANGGQHVGKIIIPQAAKKQLLKELRLLGVHRFSLFPELDVVAELSKELVK